MQRWHRWKWPLATAALFAATFLAYYPAWHGGFVWDDQSHVTATALRSVDGLRRIWFQPGSTAQYYPLVHTAFWVEHRLWGDATLGYHLVNIFLHAVSSCLLFVILRRLDVRGAALAAVVFALHPVQVETVAWISELKNALSGVFFLSSALLYLRFDRQRTWRPYAGAAVLFCLALLSKSVTATLPGALLVGFWWQRGRLEWRRDIAPLVPFAALGAVAGLFTAWIERTDIGATGAEFHFTIVERGLIAGRVIAFYLGKLAWPSNLAFVYPRWEISPSDPWQYLYPVAVAAVLVAAWLVRRRSRAPLAALLAFVGTLFPVLGFLNVYPFRFSFVADHFQYLASIPMIALASAAAVQAVRRWMPGAGQRAFVGGLALAVTLGVLTWSQSARYADALTLYRATIATNPSAWMAHVNLGALLRRTEPAEALVHLEAAVRLKPDLVEGRYNLATALQDVGRLDEAAAAYRKTIELAPGHARAYCNLATTLAGLGRPEEAERAYAESIRLAPRLALAHAGLGRLLRDQGRLEDARRSCERAVGLEPGFGGAHRDLAGVLADLGLYDEAIAEYERAIQIDPGDVESHGEIATALRERGRLDESIEHFKQAAALEPRSGPTAAGLCAALRTAGRLDEALQACQASLSLQPDFALGHFELANVLMRQGRHAEALREYQETARLAPDAAEVHCALSMVLGELGRRQEAGDQASEALRVAGDPVTAHLSMALVMEATGRLEAARGEVEKALRLSPGMPAARLALARIDLQLRTAPVPAADPAASGRPRSESALRAAGTK